MGYNGIIKNKRLVVEEEVDLPDETHVVVEVCPYSLTAEEIQAEIRALDLSGKSREEIIALAKEAEGMWSDHPDIKDSVSWVRAIRGQAEADD